MKFNESDLGTALAVLAEQRRYDLGPERARRNGLFGIFGDRNRAASVKDPDSLMSAVLQDGFGLGGNFPSFSDANGYSAKTSISLDDTGSPILEVRVRNNANPSEVSTERFIYEKGFGFVNRDRKSQSRLDTSDSPRLEKFYKDVDDFRTLYAKQYCDSFKPVSSREAERVSGLMEKRTAGAVEDFEKARRDAMKTPTVSGFDVYTYRVQNYHESLSDINSGKGEVTVGRVLGLRTENSRLRAYETTGLRDDLTLRVQNARRRRGTLLDYEKIQDIASRSQSPETTFAILASKQGYTAENIKLQMRSRYPGLQDDLGWVDEAHSKYSAQMAQRYRSYVEEHPMKVFDDGTVSEQVQCFTAVEDRRFDNYVKGLTQEPKPEANVSETYGKKYIINGQPVVTESLQTDSVQFLHLTADNRDSFSGELGKAGASYGKTEKGLDTVTIGGTTKADMGDGLYVRIDRDSNGNPSAHHTTKESFEEAVRIQRSLKGELSKEEMAAIAGTEGVSLDRKEYNEKRANVKGLMRKQMTPGMSAAKDYAKLNKMGFKPA